MKKIITILLLLLTSIVTKAQRASFKNDTARYNGISYTAGDTIKLANGSQQDKSFAFISIGTVQSALSDLDRSYANSKAVIEKIYIQRKLVYINAKIIGKTITTDADAIRVLIDLEAAVDNNEIR